MQPLNPNHGPRPIHRGTRTMHRGTRTMHRGTRTIHRGTRAVSLIALGAGIAALAIIGLPELGAGQAGYERRVLLENGSVQVVKVRYAPGAASPLHTHKFPGRAVYVVKGGTVQLLPGGDISKARKIAAKAGAVLWRPSETHIVKNAGTTTVEVLEVEIKNLGEGQ